MSKPAPNDRLPVDVPQENDGDDTVHGTIPDPNQAPPPKASGRTP